MSGDVPSEGVASSVDVLIRTVPWEDAPLRGLPSVWVLADVLVEVESGMGVHVVAVRVVPRCERELETRQVCRAVLVEKLLMEKAGLPTVLFKPGEGEEHQLREVLEGKVVRAGEKSDRWTQW